MKKIKKKKIISNNENEIRRVEFISTLSHKL